MGLDINIINLIGSTRSETLNSFMTFITNFASIEFVAVVTFLISVIFILYKKWDYLIVLILSMIVGNGFIYAIKNIVERERPNILTHLVEENSHSFPSGHSFIIVFFYGLLCYFLCRFSDRKITKFMAIALFIMIALIIGFSRIYLGVHFPSDVLAGYLFGAFWLALTIKVVKTIEKK